MSSLHNIPQALDAATLAEPEASDETRRAPATPGQQRLWFQEQQNQSAAYNVPTNHVLHDDVDSARLERALQRLVSRQTALRTTFQEEGGDLFQVVRAHMPVNLPVLRHTGPAATVVREHVAREARTAFDLTIGPLFRFELVRCADETVLLATFHHLVFDAWSVDVFRRDLEAFYADAEPAALLLQPADHALRLQRTGNRADREASLRYWKERLQGLESLELHPDRSRPERPTYAGAEVHVPLDETRMNVLHDLARRADTTPFVVGLALLHTLLARRSGQTDFVIGAPTSGRTEEDTHDLIGFFVNTLALRNVVDESTSFLTNLTQFRDRFRADFQHDAPFDQVVRQVDLAWDPRRHRVVEVMYSYQGGSAPPSGSLFTGASHTAREDVAKFDLTLFLIDEGRGGGVNLQYNTDLFDEETVHGLGTALLRLIDWVAVSPDEPLALQARVDAEHLARLQAREQAVQQAPRRHVVPSVLERARTAPETVAVIDGNAKWTYGGLVEAARRVQAGLQASGVGPGDHVGILVRRSGRGIAAALGTMMAGAAYIPIDPSLPQGRIEAMLADADARVCLVGPGVEAPDTAPFTLLNDLDGPGAVQPADSAPRTDDSALPAPSSPAYLIYTSGSTGRPKGVSISHDNLGCLAAWSSATYNLGPGTRTTHLAGLGFDASVWEVWPALVGGATVHLVDDDARIDPPALRRVLGAAEIEVAFVPTPMAEAILGLEESDPGTLTALRTMLTGGDALTTRPPAGTPYQVVNHYGPTECTVLASAGPVGSVSRNGRPPSLGTAVPFASLVLVDQHLRPVADGEPGEICIGGPGVGLGYLGFPDRTAAAFHELPDLPGSRFYRTGDQGRVRSDGQLEFLGRNDDQVKIRGLRIELGEIRCALLTLDGVEDAAVNVQDHAGGRAIVGYLTGPGAARVDWRWELMRRLPEYMVPAHLEVVQRVPLTPNGKVDWKLLQGIHASHRAVPPGTDLQEALARAWSEVLGMEVQDVSQDFFRMGGHSLRAAQVVSRIQDLFGVPLSLREFFTARTILLQEQLILDRLEAQLDDLSEDEVAALMEEPA